MIKVILNGGLGNQMFQYAAGKALSIEKKTDLFLDLTYLATRPPIPGFTIRDYELYLFDIPEKTGTLLNNDFLDKYISYSLLLIYNKLLNKNYFFEGSTSYRFNPRFFDLGPNATIEGYWNNLKYFSKYESEIKRIFDTDKLYDKKYEGIESKIKNINSVSINIRRGDYLNKKHKDVFVFLDEDYYRQAIDEIQKLVANPHFFIFSYDDPEWFGQTFNMNSSQYTMINKEYVGEKFKTYLRLISLCKHNIISNSTFAWWGAYLNKNPNKIVVSPKKWMQKYDFEVPAEWISINNK